MSFSFLQKVLYTLECLQGTRGFNGASVDDIVDFLRQHYNTDGDLCGQVRTTLRHAVADCHVREKRHRYHLLRPTSTLHRSKGSAERKKAAMNDLEKTFPTTWLAEDDKSDLEDGGGFKSARSNERCPCTLPPSPRCAEEMASSRDRCENQYNLRKRGK